jgi:hypothetical protein
VRQCQHRGSTPPPHEHARPPRRPRVPHPERDAARRGTGDPGPLRATDRPLGAHRANGAHAAGGAVLPWPAIEPRFRRLARRAAAKRRRVGAARADPLRPRHAQRLVRPRAAALVHRRRRRVRGPRHCRRHAPPQRRARLVRTSPLAAARLRAPGGNRSTPPARAPPC